MGQIGLTYTIWLNVQQHYDVDLRHYSTIGANSFNHDVVAFSCP